MIKIESNQPTKRNNANLVLSTAVGAAVGAGSRYIIPTKEELSTLKTQADSFFSNAKTATRGANRAILKYAGVGAVVAAGLAMVSKLFKKPEEKKEIQGDTFEYSEYGALIDSSDYAAELLIYAD